MWRPVDPERLGVIFGSDMLPCELPEVAEAFQACLVAGKFDFHRWGTSTLSTMYPLWMLKYLPNMPACHIGISKDARGPNNSITLGDASSLSALAEAARVLERGQAEAIIAWIMSTIPKRVGWVPSAMGAIRAIYCKRCWPWSQPANK